MLETAERISSLRKNAGMTQEELANMMFVSRSLVAMWEQGTRMPDYTNVVLLASLFNVKESDLVSGEKYIYSSDSDQIIFLKEIDEITQQPGTLYDETDLNVVIRDFLIGLSQKDRDIFKSRYFQAKTMKAIAADYKMSESAVKVRLTRIRKKLKSFIERNVQNDK